MNGKGSDARFYIARSVRARYLDGMFEEFGKLLHGRGFSDAIIDRVRASGFFLKHWMTTDPAKPHITVSDSMYGNKGLSSSFETESFLRYVQGEQRFSRLPPLNRVKVRSRAEILQYLSEPRLRRYDTEGSLTIRGQPREHKLKRAIPNPVRADEEGAEVSILPGLHRQSPKNMYSFDARVVEQRALTPLSFRLEPADLERAYDVMGLPMISCASNSIMRAKRQGLI
jgi:hypothetical protein